MQLKEIARNEDGAWPVRRFARRVAHRGRFRHEDATAQSVGLDGQPATRPVAADMEAEFGPGYRIGIRLSGMVDHGVDALNRRREGVGSECTEAAVAVRAAREPRGIGKSLGTVAASICLALPLGASAPACAQPVIPVRCSLFLHNHDGSWTSFADATFLATRGPVPVHTGERVSQRGSPAQVDLARLLNRLCESD